jgi:ribosomal-protein-alanine N-acetyltransferase
MTSSPAGTPRASFPLRVRTMQTADLEEVIEIAASLQEAPQWLRDAYETAIRPGSQLRRVALVAEDAQTGQIAGFAIASLSPPQAELESIAVASPLQRRGIAAALHSTIVDHIKAAGATELMLEVRANNARALAFYRRLGWNEVGRRVRYYSGPEDDAVLMRLELGSAERS